MGRSRGAEVRRGMKGEGAEGAEVRAVRLLVGNAQQSSSRERTGKAGPKSRAAKAASSEGLAMVNGTGCIAM